MIEPTIPHLDPVEANYAHCRVVETMPIRAETFLDWYLRQPLEAFMSGSLLVAPITGTETRSAGHYGAPGTKLLISFKDGTIAHETVLSADFPRAYSYMPYAYTNPLRLLSDHAKATMTAVPDGDGTRVVWDYAFHARNKLCLPIVALFVRFDWTRNLSTGLKALKAHLEAHGATDMHAAPPSKTAS